MLMDNNYDKWKPVRVVGKKRGTPNTCMPPLGEAWDKKMELAYSLSKAGGNMRVFIGCFKSTSKEGVVEHG